MVRPYRQRGGQNSTVFIIHGTASKVWGLPQIASDDDLWPRRYSAGIRLTAFWTAAKPRVVPTAKNSGHDMFGTKNYRSSVDEAIKDVDFDKNKYQVEFQTNAGKIVLDLWPDVAPGHCKNLIGLVRSNYYDGIVFHRVIDGFVIQAGCPKGTGTGGPGYTIKQEFNKKLHEAGVLSMARTSDPNSAGSQFFLCLGRVPHLDNQYTGFGQTADDASLQTVLKIGKSKTNAEDRPLQEQKIEKATVIVTPK